MHVTLELDDEANALYLKLRQGKVDRTEPFEASREVLIDLGKEGQVLGIEILDPGGLELVQVMKQVCRKYDLPDLSKFVAEPPGTAVRTSVA